MICAVIGYPIRLVKRPAKDFDKVRDVMKQGKEYDVIEAANKLKEIATKNGITIGASKLLDRALQEAAVIEEDQFNDEEELTMTSETVTKDPQTEAVSAEVDTQTKEQNTMSTKTKTPKAAKAKKPAKAKKAVAPKAAKNDKGPSKISQAVEFMAAEVKKAGGQNKLERGFRKELFERAAKKFDLSPITCSIQYNKQVLNG